MRVLMTCDAVGGVWQYATDLAAALVPLDVDPVLAVIGPAASEMAVPDGVTIINTGLPLDWLAKDAAEVAGAATAILRIAREQRVDVVHLNAPALAGAIDFPVPVVAVAHGCIGTWWRAARGRAPDAAFSWHEKLMRNGLIAADIAIAPSASFAETLRRTYDLPTAPAVVHNGRMPLLLPDGQPQAPGVFTVGRLWDEVKNAGLLDRVAADLAVPFHAAGSATSPQGASVSFDHLRPVGVIDDAALARELAGRPIFVSATRFEPFGLAVLEAAAAGCPLVLSGIDTFRELWTGAALLIPEDEPTAYRGAIERILADCGLRAHLGAAAKGRAGRYTREAMAAAMARHYAVALGTGKRVAA